MKREESLTVRGMGVLLLFFYHFIRLGAIGTYGLSTWPLRAETMDALCAFGQFCVPLFVFLSAYGRAASYDRACAGRECLSGAESTAFTVRAWLRLMSGYWLVFALALLALLCAPGIHVADIYGAGMQGFLNFLLDLFGLSYQTSPTLNPSWWYIAQAQIVIVLVPALMRWFRKEPISLLAAAVLVRNLTVGSILEYGSMYLLAIAAGIAFREWGVFEKLRAFRPLGREWLGRLVSSAACVLLLVTAYFARPYAAAYYVDLLAGIAMCGLGVLVFCGIPGLAQLLRLLGRHSLHLYLTHTFLILYCKDWIYATGNAWLTVAAALAVTLAVSFALEGFQRLVHFGAHVDAWAARLTAGCGEEKARV